MARELRDQHKCRRLQASLRQVQLASLLTVLDKSDETTIKKASVPEQKAESPTALFQTSSKVQNAKQAHPLSDKQTGVGKRISGTSNQDVLLFFKRVKDGQLNGATQLDKPLKDMQPAPPASRTASSKKNGREEDCELVKHEVKISYRMMSSLDVIEREYMSLINERPDLSMLPGTSFSIDTSSLDELQTAARSAAAGYMQDILKPLVALYVLKVAAANLLSFGHRAAHLYFENALEQMPYLAEYTVQSRAALQEAAEAVESGQMEDHPKLRVLLSILEATMKELPGERPTVLIIGEQQSFLTMFRELASPSMNFHPYQVDKHGTYLENGVFQRQKTGDLLKEILDALQSSDCILLPFHCVTGDLPLENFSLIVQYAECPAGCNAEHIEALLGKAGGCRKHLVLDIDHEVEKRRAMAKNTAPGTEEKRVVDQPHIPISQEEARPKYIMVFNASDPQFSFASSRRSTFQAVLKLNTTHLQVIERQVDLPLDIIITPSCCLTVYTPERLQRESREDNKVATSPQEINACEIISEKFVDLSYAFQDCIMIFEGPPAFTSQFSKSMGELYTAAMLCGLAPQCHVSPSYQVTEKLVLQMVSNLQDLSNSSVPLPLADESATDLEKFLTSFLSINPLSAHAVISCGVPLPVFVELTYQQKVARASPLGISEQSIYLFHLQLEHMPMKTSPMNTGILEKASHAYESAHHPEGLYYCKQSENDFPNEPLLERNSEETEDRFRFPDEEPLHHPSSILHPGLSGQEAITARQGSWIGFRGDGSGFDVEPTVKYGVGEKSWLNNDFPPLAEPEDGAAERFHELPQFLYDTEGTFQQQPVPSYPSAAELMQDMKNEEEQRREVRILQGQLASNRRRAERRMSGIKRPAALVEEVWPLPSLPCSEDHQQKGPLSLRESSDFSPQHWQKDLLCSPEEDHGRHTFDLESERAGVDFQALGTEVEEPSHVWSESPTGSGENESFAHSLLKWQRPRKQPDTGMHPQPVRPYIVRQFLGRSPIAQSSMRHNSFTPASVAWERRPAKDDKYALNKESWDKSRFLQKGKGSGSPLSFQTFSRRSKFAQPNSTAKRPSGKLHQAKLNFEGVTGRSQQPVPCMHHGTRNSVEAGDGNKRKLPAADSPPFQHEPQLRSFTPVDKRSKKNLGFVRSPGEKQTKLAWGKRVHPPTEITKASKVRKLDPTFTM